MDATSHEDDRRNGQTAQPATSSVFRLALVAEGGLLLLAALLNVALKIPLREQFPATGGSLSQGLLGCLPLAAMLFLLRQAKGRRWQDFNRLIDQQLVPLFRHFSVWQFALISLLAGIGEEWLFRGIIQRSIEPWLGPAAACIAASILFGAAHAISSTYALVAAVIGVYLGWLWHATGDLIPPAIAHGAYDFVALIYLTRYSPPDEPARPDDAV